MSTGSRQVATAVRGRLMGSMMAMAMRAITTVRSTWISCTCTKRRTTSTSAVHRCTRSPVELALCQA